MNAQRVKAAIRTIPGFPREGINFRDVPTLFEQPELFAYVVDAFAGWAEDGDCRALAGIDARGFVLAGALAHHLGRPLYLVRKKGKIPPETLSADYTLEYGTATLEISRHSSIAGKNVLIVDDLLATGGTAEAAGKLLRELGARRLLFGAIVNLCDLPGAERLRAGGIEPRFICEFAESEL
jgi:adenine phosphoribosyltransferase